MLFTDPIEVLLHQLRHAAILAGKIADVTLPKTITATTVLLAAACLTAAPAAADDDTFVGALEMIGVTAESPAAAAEMGRSVCAGFNAGQALPVVVEQLSAGHDLSFETASMVAGFAVAEYCDHHESALRLG